MKLECVKEDCEEDKVLSRNPISLLTETFSSLLLANNSSGCHDARDTV